MKENLESKSDRLFKRVQEVVCCETIHKKRQHHSLTFRIHTKFLWWLTLTFWHLVMWAANRCTSKCMHAKRSSFINAIQFWIVICFFFYFPERRLIIEKVAVLNSSCETGVWFLWNINEFSYFLTVWIMLKIEEYLWFFKIFHEIFSICFTIFRCRSKKSLYP